MITYRYFTLALVSLVLTACATLDRNRHAYQELERLDDLAAHELKLDLGKVERRGAEKNMAGIRSQHVLFSRRLDSRTYFIQDDRYKVDQDAGVFQGADEELISLAGRVMRELAIPTDEIASSEVLTENLLTARFDPTSRKYGPGDVRVGRRFVEMSRKVEGVPVFSSRAFIGITRSESIGFLEVHWPQISKATLREARRLQKKVRVGWQPPSRKGGSVESVEAGVIHSPALGFAMDVYPVIRVIYEPEDKTIGRKAVLYLDGNGRSVPVPRTFEKSDQPPLETRKETYRQ